MKNSNTEKRFMLNENQVIEAVINYLELNGGIIMKCSTTNQQGDDIMAEKGSRKLSIEAKGATSSKPNTNRYGKRFNPSQQKSHVSRAFFKAASVINSGENEAGIALPDTPEHKTLIREIETVLKRLNIHTFWVKHNWMVQTTFR
ncbi:MAG: hypothetical protein OXF46_03545 [Rhodobacteraceae bacterium]|nr:hypothetical protein [Paracoccaceae bacterium]